MKNLYRSPGSHFSRLAGFLLVLLTGVLAGNMVQAQIYEPEGLNMPGAWDSWSNPPTNLVLASSTQVPGGEIIKIATGTPRWQTIFSVAATGGDLIGGTYEWLYTSGPTTNYYQNKWAGVTVTLNTLQLYTKEGATNNSITLTDDKWYTMNFEDLGYMDTRAIFMETSGEPVDITSVSVPSPVNPGNPAQVDVTLSAPPSIEEYIYLRYSNDGWATSGLTAFAVVGTSGTAFIGGQTPGTIVSYYVFTTTLASVTEDFDLVTIKLNNNEGANYSFTVGNPPPAITFANLQFPETGQISPGGDFDVFGQAYIEGLTGPSGPAPGLQAWVGYHTENTDPSTWTNWIMADYTSSAGNNDEFKANLGPSIPATGMYYYTTRFQLDAGAYVYGGYSATGGGFWDGTVNVSGMLDVITGVPEILENQPTIYPNPVRDHAVIHLPAPATVQIINAMGKTVFEKALTSGTHPVNLSALASGVYHVRIVSAGRTINRTLIRQ